MANGRWIEAGWSPAPLMAAAAIGAAVATLAPSLSVDGAPAQAAMPPRGALIEIDAARLHASASTDSEAFVDDLRDGYLALARGAYARGAYALAEAYADRAAATARSAAVSPTMAAGARPEGLAALRVQLVALLDAGARMAAPDAAAEAQVAFDCAAIERSTPGGDSARAEGCERRLAGQLEDIAVALDAAAALEAEAATPTAGLAAASVEAADPEPVSSPPMLEEATLEPALEETLTAAALQRDLSGAIGFWSDLGAPSGVAFGDAPVRASVGPARFSAAPAAFVDEIETARIADARPAPLDQFAVFFDVMSVDLDARAENVLRARVGDALSSGGQFEIRLEGHADRSGDPALNERLARRRAAAVRAFIESVMGEAPLAVTVDFKLDVRGESAPAVETDDGVREAQNRRVEVEIR